MDPKQLHKPFRHALGRLNPAASRNSLTQLSTFMRQRRDRLRVLYVAVIGAAAISTAVAGQPVGPQLPVNTDSVAVANLSATREGLAVPSQAAGDKAAAADKRDSTEKSASAERRTVAGTVPGLSARAEATSESASPLAGAVAATTAPAAKPGSADKAVAAAKPAPAKPAPAKLELYHLFQLQINGYYCGPAATRIAVTAHGLYPDQDKLARLLHTTVNGTFSSDHVARALNEVVGDFTYHTTKLPVKPTSAAQKEKLRADVVRALNKSHPVVVNIAGTARDTGGATHAYPGGHYVTVVGYRNSGQQVKIADPAFGIYWMSTANLADWAGSRGYVS